MLSYADVRCIGGVIAFFRYVTVGTFLKTPEHPIWVIASETHMTVIFSPDTRLVNESDGETTVTKVERVFQEHDKTVSVAAVPCIFCYYFCYILLFKSLYYMFSFGVLP